MNVRLPTTTPTLLHQLSIGSMAKISMETRLKFHLLNATTPGNRKAAEVEEEEVDVAADSEVNNF